MNEEIYIDELERLVPKFKRAQELPAKFIAKVTDAAIGTDKTGRKCVYLTLELTDGTITKVKYTPMHISDLAEELRKMGFKKLSEIVGQTLTFVARQYRIGYPRPMPVEKLPSVTEKGGKK